MPFKSEQQRRFFHAKNRKGEISDATLKRWQDETKDSQAAGDTPKKLPTYVDKKAALDPKKLFAQAVQGAVTGAIVGSRRSLDDATLHGVSQGAALGALGGMLGGHLQGRASPGSSGTAGSIVGGGLAGYLASRGPRGESRPDVHLRIDRGAGETSKLGSELRDMMKAKRRANLDAHAKRMVARGGHWSQVDTTKKASNLAHAAELAGLGILAAPTVAEMRGKHVSDKTKHRAELAGLGVLAVPSAIELGKGAIGKLKTHRFMQGIKNMSKTKLLKSAAFHEALMKRAGADSSVRRTVANENFRQAGRTIAGKALLTAGLTTAGLLALKKLDKKNTEKRAESINGDFDTVEQERDALKSTPLGERALADSDGANQHPRVAQAFLRRLAARFSPRPANLR